MNIDSPLFLGLSETTICIATMMLEKLVANSVKYTRIEFQENVIDIKLNDYGFDNVAGVLSQADRIASNVVISIYDDDDVIVVEYWNTIDNTSDQLANKVITHREFRYADQNVIDDVFNCCVSLLNSKEPELAV